MSLDLKTAAVTAENGEFQLCLARTQQTINVRPEQTILDAMREAGFDLTTSCEQGVCGTCLTKVLAGQPDHRDLYLTEEEKESNTVVLPCVSRAFGRCLIIDA